MTWPRWLAGLFKRRRRYTLLVMRLADMFMVHPGQINTEVCSQCGEQVGIYPSGQAALRRFPGRVDIVCSRCGGPGGGQLVPGALLEPFQSHPKGSPR